ncbi:transcriptional regulator [Erwinia sp. AnSW2-5]|uniref:helix-turn-helix transcriptional regulator n=1 Tax=Erwinia sp. AnSW2-5 TaxID=3367692 RepID=UPI00385D6AD0
MPAHSPDIARERALILQTLHAAITALGNVVGRNTEIVLHDLEHPEKSVLAIANGHITGRVPGSPVLAVPLEDQGLRALLNDNAQAGNNTPTVIPDYPTRGKNGQTLRSATALYRDSNGKPFAALCINTDNSELLAAKRCLDNLLNADTSPPQPEESVDMGQLMADIIADSLTELNGNLRVSRKQAKLAAVRKMQDRGMFIVKGGIEKAAAALGVTRYTIYNYLDEIRDEQSGSTS